MVQLVGRPCGGSQRRQEEGAPGQHLQLRTLDAGRWQLAQGPEVMESRELPQVERAPNVELQPLATALECEQAGTPGSGNTYTLRHQWSGPRALVSSVESPGPPSDPPPLLVWTGDGLGTRHLGVVSDTRGDTGSLCSSCARGPGGAAGLTQRPVPVAPCWGPGDTPACGLQLSAG